MRIKILKITLAIFIICSVQLNAQKEAYNWFFGLNNGITWNETRNASGTLIYGDGAIGSNYVLYNLPKIYKTDKEIPISTEEGCFSLSNSKGELLFFSDGIFIWNRNMEKMITGSLTGNSSSAQSGIVLPFPGHKDKYIAVSIGYQYSNIMNYTIVDMSLNNGLGGIESFNNDFPAGHKGILGESVTAVPHKNGVDYWIVAPGKSGTFENASYLNSWLVTKDGIQAPILARTIGEFNSKAESGNYNSLGYIKFSIDKTKYAWATWDRKGLLFSRFNADTGKAEVTRIVTGQKFYGVEFSPSGKYLYVSKSDIYDRPSILYIINFDEIFPLGTGADYYFKTSPNVKRIKIDAKYGHIAGIQLGPDGRIYMTGSSVIAGIGNASIRSPESFFVIENPDDMNNLKIYKLKDDFLEGMPRMGLPSFSPSWFGVRVLGDEEFCANNTQHEFVLNIIRGAGSENLAYTKWNFGDNSTLIEDRNVINGTIQKHSHAYKSPGTYTITVTFHDINHNEIEAVTYSVKVKNCVLPVNPNIRINLN